MSRLFTAAIVPSLLLVADILAASSPEPIAFTYDEATQGDLSHLVCCASQYPRELPVFPFGVGQNIISGEVDAVPNLLGDFDGFAFEVPAGTRVVSAKLFHQSSSGPDRVRLLFFRLNPGAGFEDEQEFREQQMNPMDDVRALAGREAYFNAVPMPPGVYHVNQSGISYMPPGGATNYRFTFVLERVPEPSTCSIATIGFLAFARRRRVI